MQKTAIVLGASGLTGSCVLDQLLQDDRYDRIKLFGRSALGLKHPKIEEHTGDLFNMDQFKDSFIGDDLFVCIGTTKKKTPNREEYRKIDLGIPANAAQLAKKNGIKSVAVVSAIGANSKSAFEYNRIKGEMEHAVLEAGITRTYLLRPSFIAGNRKELRAGERIGLKIFKILQFLFVGKLKKYRAVEASAIAAKMIALCNSKLESAIIESDQITIN